MLAQPATSFLFLLRVRAVYEGSKAVTYFFGFWWVTNIALACLIPFSINGDVRYSALCAFLEILTNRLSYLSHPNLFKMPFITLLAYWPEHALHQYQG